MKYKYVIVAVVLFIIAVIALPSVFSAVSESYTKEEESYFSKSSYFLKGQVYKYEYLGQPFELVAVAVINAYRLEGVDFQFGFGRHRAQQGSKLFTSLGSDRKAK